MLAIFCLSLFTRIGDTIGWFDRRGVIKSGGAEPFEPIRRLHQL
jgi:hypothetical protein